MKTNKMCAIIGDITEYDSLLPLTNKRPVSLLPYDGMYRMVDFTLSNVVDAGINSIYMIFKQGMTQSVFDHIRGGKEWNLNSLPNRFFVHFFQESEYDKDGEEHYYDAIIEYLEKSNSEFTVFIGNKMLYNIDLTEVRDIHKQNPDGVTVVYKKMPKEAIIAEDLVLDISENGEVTSTKEYQETAQDQEIENLFMNIFIVKTDWLINELKQGRSEKVAVSLQECLSKMIETEPTWTYEYTGFLSNIVDIKSYYDANMAMLESKQFMSLLHSSKRIYMKNINAVPTYYSKTCDVKNSQVSPGGLIYGKVEHSILAAKTVIEEGAEMKDSIGMANVVIKKNAVVNYAILDKNVVIEEGVKVIGTEANPVVVKKNAHISEDIIQVEA